MTTSTSQQAELEKANVAVVYFCEFDFAGGKGRFSTWNANASWGGFEWLGVGTIANIGAVEESDGLEPKGISFTLNAADPSWLALAAGSVEEYRGRDAKMYFCPLNAQFQLIDTPVLCWRGIMDALSIGVDGNGAGQIILKCETSAYGLKRQPALRMNAAQHRARHPGDPSFDYLGDLIANKQLWLSKRFQEQ